MCSYVTTDEVLHMSKDLYATAVPNLEALDLSWHIYKSEAVYFFREHTKQCISMIIFLVFILVCNNFVSHPPDSPSAQHVLTTQILVLVPGL